MKRLSRPFAVVMGLTLMLNSASSGDAASPICNSPGCNSTASDVNGNTAGGNGALFNVDETASGGFVNTAFGGSALFFNTTGSNNTGIGDIAIESNTTGNSNTAIGGASLSTNGTGSLNTAAGFQALRMNVAGNNNTAVGAKALKKSTGTKNIGIGYQAGVSLISGNNNIYIGNQGAGDESQTIRVGTAQTSTFIAGIAGAFIADNRATVVIDTATGQLGLGPMISSERYKQDILPMGASSEGVLQLRPVTFSYKQDAGRMRHYGLIAEEVVRLYPELVTRTASGEAQAVQYQELIPMLLNELQREHQEIAELRKELAELRALVGSRPGQQAASHAEAR